MDMILAIGSDGTVGPGLPWGYLAEDMKRFRQITMGRDCIVGYRTYVEIGDLPGRRMRVVENNLVNIAKLYPDGIVIGGKTTYEQFLKLRLIDRIYWTVVYGSWGQGIVMDFDKLAEGKIVKITDFYSWGCVGIFEAARFLDQNFEASGGHLSDPGARRR